MSEKNSECPLKNFRRSGELLRRTTFKNYKSGCLETKYKKWGVAQDYHTALYQHTGRAEKYFMLQNNVQTGRNK